MKVKNISTLGTALLSLTALILLARPAQAATPLATVNGTVISLEEFNKKYRETMGSVQYKTRGKKAFLDDLIKRELGIQEARKLGLNKDPVVVERFNSLLFQALIENKLAKEFESIQVTDAEAKDYYSKYPEIRTSHIFVAVPPGVTADAEKKAQEKIKRIYDEYVKDGKTSFAEIAQRFSEGVAAPMGGDIDYQTREKLDPVYYDTALKLRIPGKISGIIRSQFGYHIIKLTAVRIWDDVDKALIKRLVLDEKRNQIFEKYMAQLRQRASVSIQAEALKD